MAVLPNWARIVILTRAATLSHKQNEENITRFSHIILNEKPRRFINKLITKTSASFKFYNRIISHRIWFTDDSICIKEEKKRLSFNYRPGTFQKSLRQHHYWHCVNNYRHHCATDLRDISKVKRILFPVACFIIIVCIKLFFYVFISNLITLQVKSNQDNSNHYTRNRHKYKCAHNIIN